jgi:hypothetical protein
VQHIEQEKKRNARSTWIEKITGEYCDTMREKKTLQICIEKKN